MCLYKVNEKLAGRGTKIYTGWKLFNKSGVPVIAPYYFRYYLHEGQTAVPVNQWLKANERSIGSVMGTGPRYDSGFHIYKYSYPAAYTASVWDELIAVRVKFRGVVARGREGDNEVIVAKEMYVPYKKSKRSQIVNKKKK